ncbi:Golgi apparatus membrane protein tvp38 [Erysiphe neolycopersici]|uniref:Golgi apparatus membrane protein TVP38 n=1 Tax=Erysiphe neolycopersici TaxID=212602 RepID=A0A420HW88_9PEZI|nr:Golgi apparatus membrane protein tvp38 [Erysiphe neolycopersici]
MHDSPPQVFSPSPLGDQFLLSRCSSPPLSYRARFFSYAHQVQRKVIKIFISLPLYQRVLAILFVVFVKVSLILILVYNERIFSSLAPYAAKWRDLSGGWMLLWILTFITAFPPIFGYSTTLTISGFVYGFPNGWVIVATATICGSLASFIASRTILSKYVHRIVGRDRRFEALASTLEQDGLKILCMIRLCPIPFSLSNAALSTFPTVQPVSFALATAITSPKLFIHVFIGSRMAAIADFGHNHHLDAKTRAINYFSIIASIIIGTAVGWFIYQRTMAQARELDTNEPGDTVLHHLSEQPYSDSTDENRFLLGEFSQNNGLLASQEIENNVLKSHG